MAGFKPILKETLASEGLYSKDPDDLGGETYLGISRKNFPHWAGWTIIDAAKKKPVFPKSLVSNVTLNYMVEAFYAKEFWVPIKGIQLTNQKVARRIFDTAVNQGIVRAIKIEQLALDLPATGIMDLITITKLNTII